MNLEAEKKILIDEMRDTINSMANEISDLKNTTVNLKYTLNALRKKKDLLTKGKNISDTKNKQRTLKAFSTRPETAMWFLKPFGLEAESMKVKKAKTGKTHEV